LPNHILALKSVLGFANAPPSKTQSPEPAAAATVEELAAAVIERAAT
jgi:hypothetical protein